MSGCATNSATGLSGPAALAISPDGGNVYVVGQFSNSIAEFSRNVMTGALTQRTAHNECIGCGTALGLRAHDLISDGVTV